MTTRLREQDTAQLDSPLRTPLKERRENVDATAGPTLSLQEFSKTPWVDFGNVKVGQTYRHKMQVHNPKGVAQILTVEKFPTTKGFCIDGVTGSYLNDFELPVFANSREEITFGWMPEKAGSHREQVLFKCERHLFQAVLCGVAEAKPEPKKIGAAVTTRPASTIKTSSLRAAGTTTSARLSVASKPPAHTVNNPREVLVKPSRIGKENGPAAKVPVPAPKTAQSRLQLLKSAQTQAGPNKSAGTTGSYVASTRELDDRYHDAQADGFVNWLNHILAPQEPEAPPLSPQTHATPRTLRQVTAARMLSRQADAISNLMKSPYIKEISEILAAAIRERKFALRTDSQSSSGLSIRQALINLLECYNPWWLRLGLSVLLRLPPSMLAALDDPSCLRKVLGEHMLCRSCSSHISAAHEQSCPALHTFLMLVLLLDTAKERKILADDPCLFVKHSPIKSSEGILKQFARTCMLGEGDVVKHMGFFGYKVMHVQTGAHEYSYRVSNLALDLRDGACLARLLEQLTATHGIVAKLTLPATSDIQRAKNMSVVLRALAAHGVSVRGPGPEGTVTERDIVTGHRERTMGLLWRIIYHFQVQMGLDLPLLSAELSRCKRDYARRKGHEYEEPVDAYGNSQTLSLLLRWCQVIGAMYDMKVVNFTNSFSDGRLLCYIINYYHPAILPKSSIHQETTATTKKPPATKAKEEKVDPRTWVGVFSPTTGVDPFRKKLLSNEKANFQLAAAKVMEIDGVPPMVNGGQVPEQLMVSFVSHLCSRLILIGREARAATKIQRWWRQHAFHLLGQEAAREHQAAKRIAALYRGFKARRAYARIRAVAVISRAWVAHTTQREVFTAFAREWEASIVLQTCVRGFLARKQAQTRYAAVLTLQRVVRGHLGRMQYRRLVAARQTVVSWLHAVVSVRRQRATFQMQKAACIYIQSWWRMVRAVRTYHHTLGCVVVLQAAVRGMLVRRWMDTCHHAAAIIQRAYRLHQVNRRWSAAVRIQSAWRGYAACALYRGVRDRVICLQAHARGCLVRRHVAVQNAAASVIQSRVRCMQARQRYLHQRQSTVCIQAWWRGTMQRRRYQAAVGAVVGLQAWAKGCLTRHMLYVSHLAAATIQGQWHTYVARQNFKLMRYAAVRVQAWWRGVQARGRVQAARGEVVLLQAVCRSWLARAEMKVYVHTVVSMQRRFRGILIRRQHQHEVSSVVRVQAWWRMATVRMRYVRLVAAVTSLQARARGHMVRVEVEISRMAATRIQRWYFTHKQKQVFVLQRQAAVCMQAWWRGTVQRHTYVRVYMAVLGVQACARGWMARRRLGLEMLAATIIQSRYKGYMDRRRFMYTRSCAVRIQSWWRCQRAARTYSTQRTAVVRMQALCRGYLVRRDMAVRHMAATIIQSRIRGHQRRQAYLHTLSAVITIQAHARAAIQRRAFCRLRTGVLCLQGRFRLRLHKQQTSAAHMHARQQHHAAIRIQSAYRGWMARRQADALRYQNAIRLHWLLVGVCVVRAVVHVQREFRRRQAVARWQHKIAAVVLIQTHVRGWLARREVQMLRQMQAGQHAAAVTIQTGVRGFLARREAARRRAAILFLQAYWRGHAVRRTQGPKLVAIRVRAQAANREAIKNPGLRLGARGERALALLLSAKMMSTVLDAAENLDTITRLSRLCCERMVGSGGVPVLFKFMKTCNRSKPHQAVLHHAVNILVSLTSHDTTVDEVYRQADAVTVLVDILQNFRDVDPLLLGATTTLINMCSSPDRVKGILSKAQDVQRIKAVYNLIKRKHEMAIKTKIGPAGKTKPQIPASLKRVRDLLVALNITG